MAAARNQRRPRRAPIDLARPGLGVDSAGLPVIDPTENVLNLVEAAVKRLDDLREAERRHTRETMEIRAQHTRDMRLAETARIDAIRAVDVGAVNRAAEVAAQVAQTLAAQVSAVAEANRAQVSAAATAQSIALANALEPMQKSIDDLRRAQYEAQGVKSNVTESRLNYGAIFGGLAVLISMIGLVVLILAR